MVVVAQTLQTATPSTQNRSISIPELFWDGCVRYSGSLGWQSLQPLIFKSMGSTEQGVTSLALRSLRRRATGVQLRHYKLYQKMIQMSA